MLVNAIQEQQEMIDDMKEELEALKAMLTDQNTESRTEVLNQSPSIEQNQPNPFHDGTSIQYYLPETTQQAELRISDGNGRLLKIIPLQGVGAGQIDLEKGTLGTGTYSYTLIAAGQLIGTKQMILTQ